MIVRARNSKPKKQRVLSITQGTKAKTVEYSTDLKVRKIRQIPNAKPTSPTRLTSIALIADLLA
jgi:hypothetical protein